MDEIILQKTEVSKKLLSLLARHGYFKPAFEFLQPLAFDGPSLRRGVAEVMGVQSYDSMRAFMKSTPRIRWDVGARGRAMDGHARS